MPGPMSMNTMDDALTLPIPRITIAIRAGSRQPPLRTARMVRPTSHGSPAQARRSTEIRAVNASWYGVSMYTTAPAKAPKRRAPSMVKSHRAPKAARSEIVPNHRRCATQSGTPTDCMSQ